MKKYAFPLFCFLSVCCCFGAADIALPAPEKKGGLTVLEALARRSSGRELSERKLTEQQLANLLWAGFGVNRPDGRRTAPSASNTQEIEIYALLPEGGYVYDAEGHRLKQVSGEDLRPLGGKDPAPLMLVYVADLSKRQGPREGNKNVACINSGFISENIYLYCASEGLSTCYRGGFDRKQLPAKLGLREEQEIIAAQSVGYPRASDAR